MIYREAKEYTSPNKIYVQVVAEFMPDGQITPREIIWEDGRRFAVDRVEDVCRAASRKAGGCGIRYAIMVLGHLRYLFLEETRWFVERKTS
jgi:hypothetical protein